MEVVIALLSIFGIIAIAFITGKLVSLIKLPAILGWLIIGIIFGPYLVNLVTLDTLNCTWYKIIIKFFECFAGVMIGKELIFKKIASSGKQIIGITIMQSIGTFFVVTGIFAIVFAVTNLPLYLSFIFGGIALATAPAPALSIVNEYKTSGPVTRTLIPLAAIDDVIGVIVFFTVITIMSSVYGVSGTPVWMIILSVLMPFVIGVLFGYLSSLVLKKNKKANMKLILFLLSLLVITGIGIILDIYLFKSFMLNYMLIGMAFSGTLVNLIKEEDLSEMFKKYNPVLNFALVVCIVNLGMPLDYKLITGACLYTFIYILSRALGKIGGSFVGSVVTKADKNVTKYLGLTLLPHSGVSLIFTGIASTMLVSIDSELANIVSGTICAAAIINEIIAVVLAKVAFKAAHEIPERGNFK